MAKNFVQRSEEGGRVSASATLAGLLVAALIAAPAGAEDTASGEISRHVWLDAEGETLPFQGNTEIEGFLREARVVEREAIGVGINRMDRLLVERDGVRAHAVFRTVESVEENISIGGRLYLRFKDSWANECAAYAVAQLFGMDNVPPTVRRHLDRQQGSMQIWVEKARDHTAEDFRPTSPIAWVKQTWGMFAFDNLIFNADRNAGNILAGEHYRLWLVDHTRAFQPRTELLSPERVVRLSRRAWARLLETSEDQLADATREFLDPDQVIALKERRKRLVDHIQKLIDTQGEEAILY